MLSLIHHAEAFLRWLKLRAVGTLHTLGEILRALRIARAPILVAIFATLTLAVPGQIREAYRITIEEFHVLQIILTVSFLVITALGIAISTRDISIARSTQAASASPKMALVLRWLPWLTAALVPFGMAAGLVWAGAEILGTREFAPDLLNKYTEFRALLKAREDSVYLYYLAAGFCSLLAGAVFLMPALYERLSTSANPRPHQPQIIATRLRPLFFVVVATLSTVPIFAFPMEFAPSMGTLAVILTFILVLALLTSWITAASDRYGVPFITMLFLWAVGLSLLDINDNHNIVLQKPANPKPYSGLSGYSWLEDAEFLKWLGNRGDLAHYNDRPYPVFVVSAAGGGLYAAEHAATVLARLQDRCPHFSQHVFAISGISGGSLGAAIFSGLMRQKGLAANGPWKQDETCEDGPLAIGPVEQQVKRFFHQDNDLLSPVAAKALFHDLLQRFVPVRFKSLDRATALEDGFGRAWDKAVPDGKHYFEKSFLDLWDPADAAPALLLNATDVDRGRRIVISPFTIENAFADSINFYFYIGWAGSGTFLREKPIDTDVSLKTAVGVSARFPWVSPPASLIKTFDSEDGKATEAPITLGSKVRLVDGGYFENSGSETVSDIIDQLSRYFENEEYLRRQLCEHPTPLPDDASPRTREKRRLSMHICAIKSAKEERQRSLRESKLREFCQLDRIKANRPANELEGSISLLCQRTSIEEAYRGEFCAANHLRRYMGHLCDRKLVSIYVINIGIGEDRARRWQGASELLTPVRAMLNAREQRGHLAEYRLKLRRVPCDDEFLGVSKLPDDIECDPLKFGTFKLNPDFRIPLAWRLSSRTRELIDFASGHADRAFYFFARQGFSDERSDQVKALTVEARRSACNVQRILDGDRPGFERCAKRD